MATIAGVEQQVRFCTARRRRPSRLRRSRKRPADRQGCHLADQLELRLGQPSLAPLAGRARRSATPSSATTSAAAACPTARPATSRSTPGSATCEAVVEAAGLERFALLGVSQGAAIALVYAARHPSGSRTSSCTGATPAAGSAQAGRRVAGGGADLGDPRRLGRIPTPTFRRVFSMLFLPEGTAGADGVVRRPAAQLDLGRDRGTLYDARGSIDVVEYAPRCRRRRCRAARDATASSRSRKGACLHR